jgi:hypothetical protein
MIFSGHSLGLLFNHEDVGSIFIRNVGEIRTIQQDITLKNQRFDRLNSRHSFVQWNHTTEELPSTWGGAGPTYTN